MVRGACWLDDNRAKVNDMARERRGFNMMCFRFRKSTGACCWLHTRYRSACRLAVKALVPRGQCGSGASCFDDKYLAVDVLVRCTEHK